jgi:hypothetical protein
MAASDAGRGRAAGAVACGLLAGIGVREAAGGLARQSDQPPAPANSKTRQDATTAQIVTQGALPRIGEFTARGEPAGSGGLLPGEPGPVSLIVASSSIGLDIPAWP